MFVQCSSLFHCISSKLHQIQYSFSDPTSTIVKYCISSRLTVNDFFLSFSNIIHCSLMFKLALGVKYCISSKLTVYNFFLSFSNIIHCSLVYQLYQLYLHYIDSERPLPLVCYCHRIVSTVFYISNSAHQYTWILYLELVSYIQ